MSSNRKRLGPIQVAGVDGCRGGWCVASLSRTGAGKLAVGVSVCRSFSDVLQATQKARIVAIDIPIGLPRLNGYPRLCDAEARKLLSKARGSSVFYMPPREVVVRSAGLGFHATVTLSRKISGRGMSLQTFYILDKVRDVDRCLTPLLQDRVYEVHPELSFWAILGRRPLASRKKTREGLS